MYVKLLLFNFCIFDDIRGTKFLERSQQALSRFIKRGIFVLEPIFSDLAAADSSKETEGAKVTISS